MRMWRMLCVAGLLAAVVSAPAFAASEAAKQTAIDDGLEYLAQNQAADGRWNYGGDPEDTAATGAALLAFLDEGHQAGSDVVINATNYGDVVGKGLTYLFSQATTYAIAPQTHGNPDGDGNGLGVKFVLGGNNGRDTYVTGLVIPALVSTGTPNAVVANGALTGWTYKQVVQNAVDYFAYGQNENGTARGGWRYFANSGDSDNSTAQWPAIAMSFATGMGVTTPNFVKDELAVWTAYIQNANGGSGYDSPGNIPNESKTGGLLVEMIFAGDDTATVPYNLAHPKVQAALGYLNGQWQAGANSTWNGNFNNPYAMWSIYKGLELTIGVDADTSVISNLHADPGDVDNPDHGWNWWEDYCEWLVSNQAGGTWPGHHYWGGAMATGWYVNILAATEIPAPIIPEPLTMIAVAGALVGLGGYVRKRRRA